MGDSTINYRIAQYLQSNNEVSYSDIKSAMDGLDLHYGDVNSLDEDTSIFAIGDGVSKDEFTQYLSGITGKDSDAISDYASLLFDVLDSDDGDSEGTLTAGELDFLSDDDGETITAKNFWNLVLYPDEDVVNSFMETEEETEEASEASSTSSSDSTDTDEAITISSTEAADDEDSNSDSTSETSSSGDDTTVSLTSSSIDYNNASSVKNLLETFIDPDIGISSYKDAMDYLSNDLGLLSDDDVSKIEQTLIYDGLSQDDKDEVDMLVNSFGYSLEGAMNILSEKGSITIDEDILTKDVLVEDAVEEETEENADKNVQVNDAANEGIMDI